MVATLADIVERLCGLGARLLVDNAGPAGELSVLQDPEGNEFCVIDGHGPA